MSTDKQGPQPVAHANWGNGQVYVYMVTAKIVFGNSFLRSSGFSADSFNLEAMREASRLFLGLHDFRTFMGKETSVPEKITRRVVDQLDVVETPALCYSPYSWPSFMSNEKSDYTFLNIYMKSSGFLYKQVSHKEFAHVSSYLQFNKVAKRCGLNGLDLLHIFLLYLIMTKISTMQLLLFAQCSSTKRNQLTVINNIQCMVYLTTVSQAGTYFCDNE